MPADFYGSRLHPGQVPLGEPDHYGIVTYVEPNDPRLPAQAERYNGYTNRETYDVHLWCSSATESFYDMCRAVALDGTSDLDGGERLRVAFPDLVQAEWSSSTLYPGGIAGELINCALARVNWREIAASLREV